MFRDRLLLGVAAAAQAVVAMLDLLALLILGFVVTAAAQTNQGLSPAAPGYGTVLKFVDIPIAWLALGGAAVLVLKSFMSLGLTRQIYSFLAGRQATVSGSLAKLLLTGSILDLQRRTSQQVVFALMTGVNAATVGTLGPAAVIMAELSLLLLLTLGLILVDPLIALFTLSFFSLLASVLQLGLGRWASRLGEKQRDSDILSMEALQHAIRVYREIKVAGRRGHFVELFATSRRSAAAAQADTFVLSQFGKYVFEIGLVCGGGLLVLILFWQRTNEEALAVLAVFLLASSRMVPSLLRLQAAFTAIRNSAGLSQELFEFLDEVGTSSSGSITYSDVQDEENGAQPSPSDYSDFVSNVNLCKVSLMYPGSSIKALDEVSIDVPEGSSLAIVGPTGAGKTSLVDVMLGILEPTTGTVVVSGVSPSDATARWPGAVAYVPQDVAILSGTILSNIALGIPQKNVDDEAAWHALKLAHLEEFVRSCKYGLGTIVGENGVRLSGGQRQRLGVARALYTCPKLLVLDEATSALDAATEYELTDTLRDLRGMLTTVVVAHRLATVRAVDQVVYLDQGKMRGIGTFETVRSLVPDFDKQARLLGL